MASISVVRGGRSLEREFSLRSGHHVAAALHTLGHDVTEVDVDQHLTQALSDSDAVFIALHGRDGEDGTIQAICESLGHSYTGSDAFSCQIAFDKVLAKGMFRHEGLSTPDSYDLSSEAVRSMGAGPALRAGAERLGYPLVVKPVAQGSALGLVVVHEHDQLSSAVMTAFNYGDRVMLERYVSGTELAVSVLGPELHPLPPVEIRSASGAFDFESRVAPGGVEYLCPSPLGGVELEAAQQVAVGAAKLLGMRDLGRVDMIVTEAGEPMVLEVNPCPGLTESSLLPISVSEKGLSFESFVQVVVDSALARETPATRSPAAGR